MKRKRAEKALRDSDVRLNPALDVTSSADAEAALRESEALLRVALAGGRMGTWRADLNKRLIWGDPKFLALWGFPPSGEPHPLSLFTDRLSPEGASEIEATVSRGLKAGEEFDGPTEIVAGPTAGRWIRWRGQLNGNAPSTLNGISFDITEQRRAERSIQEGKRQRAFLLHLSDALRPLTDPQELASEATRLLGDYLQADRTFLTKVEADEVALIVGDEYLRAGTPSVMGRHSFDQFGAFVSRTLRQGYILAVEDVSTLAELTAAERANCAAIGISAYLLIPLMRGGRLTAYFTINHRTARAWTEVDKAIARQTADRTWEALERARVEAALRESEGRFRAFAETTHDVIWLRSADTMQWEYVSPALEKVYGVSFEAILRGNNFRRWLGLILPADRKQVVRAFQRVRGGERVNHEFRIRRPSDGQVRWVRNTDFPFVNAAGEVSRIGGIGQDITEAKLAVAELEHSEERFRQFADHSGNALWIVDLAKARIDYASPAFDVIWDGGTAHSPDTLKQWEGTLHPEDAVHVMAALQGAAGGETQQYQYRVIRQDDGAMRWLRETSFPIRDVRHDVVKIGRITEDLTRHEGVQIYLVGAMKTGPAYAGALRRMGYRVRPFGTATDLLETVAVLTPGVVLLDMRHSQRPAAAVVREIKGRAPELRIIVIFGEQADGTTMVGAMKAGAVDCLKAPLAVEDLNEPILEVASGLSPISATPSQSPGYAARLGRLSSREREVLEGLVGGGTNKTIALELSISPRTVELHRARLMERLNADSLAELLSTALTAGIRPKR